jgi:hypothetical protein
MKPFLTRAAHAALGLLLALAACQAAWAHKGSDAYLQVSDQPALSLRYAVAIKDLELVLNVDANGDGKVTWGEIKAATPALSAVLASAIALDGAPALQWQFDGLEARGDGAYVRMLAAPPVPAGAALALRYTLFQTQDATHRLLVAGQLDGRDLLLTLSPTNAQATVLRAGAAAAAVASTPASPANSAWRSLSQYFLLGVHHLLEGYDHLAFLLALVLPLHLRLWPRRAALAASAPAARSQRSEWASLLRTITAFTLGHSITLILATLGYTSASAAWVEPAIAVSIGVTALLNVYPQPWLRTELLAGAFGLVHGYGFAGLLTEAAAPSGLLGWALGGFNLGVEAGQLIAVTGWLIVSQPLVDWPLYERWVLRRGSWLLLLLSAFWFLERVR